MKNQGERLLPVPTLGMLLLTLAAIIAPHVGRLPPWATLLVVVCGIWRLRIGQRAEALPPGWLRTLLALAAAAGIFGSYGTLLGRDAGTALLVVMAALKLLEMRRRRDVHVVLYLGFFLIITQFLYSQALWTVLYLLLTVWATTTLLMSVHQATDQSRPWRYLRAAGAMLLQALPIMAILFVLFPRFAGPLWGLPDDAHGRTGLSDSMTPGAISELSQSDAVAFRVSFDGPIPPQEALYWRGPVLTAYDGRTWSTGSRLPAPADVVGEGEPVDYSVILQPHGWRWLFALEAPSRIPDDAELNQELELLLAKPVQELMRYEASSTSRYRLDPVHPGLLPQRYLQLPAAAHPRARALAASWREVTDDPGQLLAQAQAFFVGRPFVYTLTPPLLSEDPVDQFLFDTRRGFCEHYAGAFVVLMRAAGVPARVVTGYQGGELNPIDGQLTVRQSDAHAWSEVWLPERGWLRVDPTGWVSPERVELGLGGALSGSEPVPMMARLEESWLKDVRLRWDALNHGWDRWVLAYGPELQRQVLGRVGLETWQRMAMALAIALGATITVIAGFLLLRGRRPPRDPLQRLYQRFCDKLARRGTSRLTHEGPRAYAARVTAAHPELAGEVNAITDLYIRLRYGGLSTRVWLRRLRDRVERFRP